MAVDPLGRSTPPRPDQLRTDGSRRVAETGANAGGLDTTETVLAADVLAISAQALESSRAEGVPTGTVSPEQLRDIRQKLADGAYDTPEVVEHISQHVVREIELPIAWGGLG